MLKKVAAITLAGSMLVGCSNMSHQQQRMLSGGAIGAAGGAAVAGLAGGSMIGGALIGGAGGAAIGGLTH